MQSRLYIQAMLVCAVVPFPLTQPGLEKRQGRGTEQVKGKHPRVTEGVSRFTDSIRHIHLAIFSTPREVIFFFYPFVQISFQKGDLPWVGVGKMTFKFYYHLTLRTVSKKCLYASELVYSLYIYRFFNHFHKKIF